MSKKTKKNSPGVQIISSEDALSEAANRYVELSIGLTQKKAEHERRIAQMNTSFELLNKTIADEAAALEASIQLFAESRPDLFPATTEDGPKSRTYLNAVVGFRRNPPKVEKRISKDTFEAIVERLQKLPWGERYVKYSDPTLDKDTLLKDRAILTEDQLAQAGIKFAQGDTFFIAPKFESAADVTRKAA